MFQFELSKKNIDTFGLFLSDLVLIIACKGHWLWTQKNLVIFCCEFNNVPSITFERPNEIELEIDQIKDMQIACFFILSIFSQIRSIETILSLISELKIFMSANEPIE